MAIKQFIKENWFKLLSLLMLGIIALSIGYHYVFTLPNIENRKIELQSEKEDRITTEIENSKINKGLCFSTAEQKKSILLNIGKVFKKKRV